MRATASIASALIAILLIVLLHPTTVRAASAARADRLDVLRMIRAIKMTENTPIDFIGGFGERSEYQFRRTTWEQYSKMPFERASSQDHISQSEVTRVAIAHCKWAMAALRGLHMRETPYAVALVWKNGYGNVERLHLSSDGIDYARRAQNIYETLDAVR